MIYVYAVQLSTAAATIDLTSVHQTTNSFPNTKMIGESFHFSVIIHCYILYNIMFQSKTNVNAMWQYRRRSVAKS